MSRRPVWLRVRKTVNVKCKKNTRAKQTLETPMRHRECLCDTRVRETIMKYCPALPKSSKSSRRHSVTEYYYYSRQLVPRLARRVVPSLRGAASSRSSRRAVAPLCSRCPEMPRMHACVCERHRPEVHSFSRRHSFILWTRTSAHPARTGAYGTHTTTRPQTDPKTRPDPATNDPVRPDPVSRDSVRMNSLRSVN